eukprot:scaffold1874_cov237-Pinguiococcus_pyrenoidosus.AAC.4
MRSRHLCAKPLGHDDAVTEAKVVAKRYCGTAAQGQPLQSFVQAADHLPSLVPQEAELRGPPHKACSASCRRRPQREPAEVSGDAGGKVQRGWLKAHSSKVADPRFVKPKCPRQEAEADGAPPWSVGADDDILGNREDLRSFFPHEHNLRKWVVIVPDVQHDF